MIISNQIPWLITFFWMILLAPSSQASNSQDIYRKNNLILPPKINDRLAVLNETITFIILSKALIKDATLTSPKVSLALNILHNVLKSLFDLLLSRALLRSVLPRVSDQTDYKSKLLARYRIDSCNPWACVINLNHISDPIKESLSNDELSSNKSRSEIIDKIKPFLEPYLSDDNNLVFSFKPPARKPFKCYLYNFFIPFIQHEVVTLLCQNVSKSTGLPVRSINDINRLFKCTSHASFPSSKRGIYSTDFYVKAPYLKFSPK